MIDTGRTLVAINMLDRAASSGISHEPDRT